MASSISSRLGRLRDRVLRRRVGSSRWVEMFVVALACPLASRLLTPEDPLGLDAAFPWILIGPTVFAARYGTAGGVGCAVLAAMAMLASVSAYPDRSVELAGLAIGMIVLALLAGDVAGGWRRRALRAEAENGYLKHRLKEFSNDYHVLKVSHGQLEQCLAGQRMSLRQALLELEPALISGGDALGSGDELMAVFARFCSIQVAGLYPMRSEQLIEEQAVALHGGMGDLPRFDPLIRLAIAEKKLVSVKLDSAAGNQHEAGLLAVVPIVDSQGRLYGILAIRDMHFMAFQQENLNVLALLAGYIGDRIAQAGGFGDAPANRFVAELDSALRFAHSHDVESTLAVLRLRPHRKASDVADLITRNTRSLDSVWLPPVAGVRSGTTVVVLLPLVGTDGGRAWLARLAEQLQTELNLPLSEILAEQCIESLCVNTTRAACLALVHKVSITAVDKLDDTSVMSGDVDVEGDDDDNGEVVPRVA